MGVEYLSSIKKVSTRTIYNDIKKLNIFLEENNIEKVEIIKKRGIVLNNNQRKQLKDIIHLKSTASFFTLSPIQRISVIICRIIGSKKEVTIEMINNVVDVSRNTIISDIKVATSVLLSYNLKLQYKHKYGYIIQGDEIKRRAVFFCILKVSHKIF